MLYIGHLILPHVKPSSFHFIHSWYYLLRPMAAWVLCSCMWLCGSPSSGRTCPPPPTRSSSTYPPVLALPYSLFPIHICICFLRPLAQPHRCVNWNRPQRTASSDCRHCIRISTCTSICYMTIYRHNKLKYINHQRCENAVVTIRTSPI